MSRALSKEVSLEGTGLHTGEKCVAVFKPASGTGIRFFLDGKAVPALLENVVSTARGTNLEKNGVSVFTVEHILSAAAGLLIDDMDVFLTATEPPALDGSALGFAEAFLSAGISETGGKAKTFFLRAPVKFQDGDSVYEAAPAEKLSFSFLFLRDHPLVPRQEREFFFSPESYVSQIAPARTFAFEEEISALKKAGLAKGGSEENAVVVKKDGFLASGGLRFPDELVRHKILDLIGDLKLCGARLGPMSVRAVCGGHRLNVAFARLIFQKGDML